jgi:hypothetical protein
VRYLRAPLRYLHQYPHPMKACGAWSITSNCSLLTHRATLWSATYNHTLHLEPRIKIMQELADFLEQAQRGRKVRGHYETQLMRRWWRAHFCYLRLQDFGLRIQRQNNPNHDSAIFNRCFACYHQLRTESACPISRLFGQVTTSAFLVTYRVENA